MVGGWVYIVGIVYDCRLCVVQTRDVMCGCWMVWYGMVWYGLVSLESFMEIHIHDFASTVVVRIIG